MRENRPSGLTRVAGFSETCFYSTFQQEEKQEELGAHHTLGEFKKEYLKTFSLL
ncbi:hypothetical protein K8R66_04165 [bacterium]|nr:hypothetical protein [bacterium]